jgi:hypothetical protein
VRERRTLRKTISFQAATTPTGQWLNGVGRLETSPGTGCAKPKLTAAVFFIAYPQAIFCKTLMLLNKKDVENVFHGPGRAGMTATYLLQRDISMLRGRGAAVLALNWQGDASVHWSVEDKSLEGRLLSPTT